MADAAPATYTYAILRLVPSVERGECFNVGVALLCRPRRFLGVRTALDERKLAALGPHLNPDAIRAHLAALEAIAQGDSAAGPLAALDLSERFHWIASPASTILQPSPIHTGLTQNPAATLARLFATLVTKPE